MFYTTDERGVMNNYAVEPKVYVAEFPSLERQRQYVLQAAIASLLLVSVFLTALAIS